MIKKKKEEEKKEKERRRMRKRKGKCSACVLKLVAIGRCEIIRKCKKNIF